MAEKQKAPQAVSDKQKALETALAQIEKQFGKGAVMKMGQNSSMNVAAIPTGSLSLDLALGIGGVPKGRIIEIFGPESSGKTRGAAHCGRGPEAGRRRCFYRCGARFGPGLRGGAGRRY
jgi:recombination protein RecA